MEERHTALDAVISVISETLCLGLGDDAVTHVESRAVHADLTEQARIQALVGPKAGKLMREVCTELERQTAVRFNTILQHPRFGRTQLMNERAQAMRTLQKTLLDVIRAPSSRHDVSFVAATLRVTAVIRALGENCMSEPRAGKKEGESHVRRPVSAADAPPPIRSLIMKAVEGEAGWSTALDGLRQLERTDLNNGGIVTTVLALAGLEDGVEQLQRIANRIDRAGGDDFTPREQGEKPDKPMVQVSAQPSPRQELRTASGDDFHGLPPSPIALASSLEKAPSRSASVAPSGHRPDYIERLAARRAERLGRRDLTM